MHVRFIVALTVAFAAPALNAGDKMPFDAPTFVPASDDVVIDRGTIDVPRSGPTGRAETFTIVRRADGGYSIFSEVIPQSGGYSARGRWDFDGNWIAQRAVGIGEAGEPKVIRRVLIERIGPDINLRQDTLVPGSAPVSKTWSVACGLECMIDMAPSALPMTVMGQRFDRNGAHEQTFRWVGISTTQDSVLLDGVARLTAAGEVTIAGRGGEPPLEITHWRFFEQTKDEISGRAGQMIGHFWNDANGFPRKFGMGFKDIPTTIGVRVGDESFADQMAVE